MNVKTTITLMDIGLKRFFIKFSFILGGGGAFGSERVHFHVQEVLAQSQNPLILRP